MTSYKLQLSPDVTTTKINDSVVLFSKKTGAYFGLNEIGYEMLQKLETTDSLSLVRAMSADYQVEESQIAQDMAELVESMESQKLVVRVACQSPTA